MAKKAALPAIDSALTETTVEPAFVMVNCWNTGALPPTTALPKLSNGGATVTVAANASPPNTGAAATTARIAKTKVANLLFIAPPL